MLSEYYERIERNDKLRQTVTARYIADDRSKVDMVVRRVAEYVNG